MEITEGYSLEGSDDTTILSLSLLQSTVSNMSTIYIFIHFFGFFACSLYTERGNAFYIVEKLKWMETGILLISINFQYILLVEPKQSTKQITSWKNI